MLGPSPRAREPEPGPVPGYSLLLLGPSTHTRTLTDPLFSHLVHFSHPPSHSPHSSPPSILCSPLLPPPPLLSHHRHCLTVATLLGIGCKVYAFPPAKLVIKLTSPHCTPPCVLPVPRTMLLYSCTRLPLTYYPRFVRHVLTPATHPFRVSSCRLALLVRRAALSFLHTPIGTLAPSSTRSLISSHSHSAPSPDARSPQQTETTPQRALAPRCSSCSTSSSASWSPRLPPPSARSRTWCGSTTSTWRTCRSRRTW